jgi:hypothetical protein
MGSEHVTTIISALNGHKLADVFLEKESPVHWIAVWVVAQSSADVVERNKCYPAGN